MNEQYVAITTACSTQPEDAVRPLWQCRDFVSRRRKDFWLSLLEQFKQFWLLDISALYAQDVRNWVVDTVSGQAHFVGVNWLTQSYERSGYHGVVRVVDTTTREIIINTAEGAFAQLMCLFLNFEAQTPTSDQQGWLLSRFPRSRDGFLEPTSVPGIQYDFGTYHSSDAEVDTTVLMEGYFDCRTKRTYATTKVVLTDMIAVLDREDEARDRGRTRERMAASDQNPATVDKTKA